MTTSPTSRAALRAAYGIARSASEYAGTVELAQSIHLAAQPLDEDQLTMVAGQLASLLSRACQGASPDQLRDAIAAIGRRAEGRDAPEEV